MAIQFTPIAAMALRYGAVALATFAATRIVQRGRLNQPVEDALDEAPEGLHLRRDTGEVNGSARWKRTFRIGQRGPGVMMDAAALGRVRLRRA
ncbi:MAG: hypothetical protein RIB61_09885 [Roseicyclus sp.]|jgi:hypothetical protein